jgi:Spy/CpxP family protein refolding chaperone
MPGAYPMAPGQLPMGLPGPATGYPMPPNPVAELNLTAEQQGRMKEIGQTAEKNNAATLKKLAEQTAKLNQQMAVERPDPKGIGAIYAEVSNLQRQLIEAGIETHNKQMDVMTPEQKAKWRSFQQSVSRSFR